MTNLEKYYGIKVLIENHLEPISLEILKERAIRIASIKNVDLDKFNVYYHKIQIFDLRKKRHHSKRFKLEDRIELLDVTFKVNKKQRKYGSIRFFNTYVGIKEDNGIYYDGEFELRRIYFGSALKGNLETELITFIDKNYVRESHKKIKLEILPQPTVEFELILKNNTSKISNIDIPLKNNIKLNIRESKIKEVSLNNYSDNISTDKNGNTILKLTNYNIENAYGMGSNSEVSIKNNQHNNYYFPENIDSERLQKELFSLRERVLNDNSGKNEVDQFNIATAITEAIEESKKGNKDEKLIVNKLLKGGIWLFNLSKEIGVSILTEIIKKNMGLL